MRRPRERKLPPMYCDRCHIVGGKFEVISEQTTLGHDLKYRVCIDREECKARIEQQKARHGPRPVARIEDLYPAE